MGVHRLLLFDAVNFEFDDLFHVLLSDAVKIQRRDHAIPKFAAAHLFSGQRQVAKAHADCVIHGVADGRHYRRQQSLTDAVDFFANLDVP